MFLELGTLERFGHAVPFHFICRALLHLCISLADLISDEEISVVDVPGSLAHALLAIVLQLDGTGVILEHDGGFDWMA